MQTATDARIYPDEITRTVGTLAQSFPLCPTCDRRVKAVRWFLQLTGYGLSVHATLACKEGHSTEASVALA